MSNVMVFHSGTALKNGKIVTDGGRVLGVTGLGPVVAAAIDKAYAARAGHLLRRRALSQGHRRAGARDGELINA